VAEFGIITYDFADGGTNYAYCDADQLGLELISENTSEIRRAGIAIKYVVSESVPIDHPSDNDPGYGVIFGNSVGGPETVVTCVISDEQINRSSTGNGG